ncbi:MAG: hypothetical protein KIT72_04250 [Polyangiaceae bacterium]|nr:hypothetical protein [Polyangiaceae bacterium]MCW5789614.1 hypothetical protein [Polyangiaceae bacterium]
MKSLLPALLIPTALLLAACGSTAPAQHPTEVPAEPGAEPTSPEAPAPREAPPSHSGTQADGEACDTAADCVSGICEGKGCGPGGGRCVPLDRMCTFDHRQYCGCDGETFGGSGSCPLARYEHRGPCGDPEE